MQDSIKNHNLNFFIVIIFILIAIFLPKGEPILLHLLRYRVFAVKDHDFIPCASHLQQH